MQQLANFINVFFQFLMKKKLDLVNLTYQVIDADEFKKQVTKL